MLPYPDWCWQLCSVDFDPCPQALLLPPWPAPKLKKSVLPCPAPKQKCCPEHPWKQTNSKHCWCNIWLTTWPIELQVCALEPWNQTDPYRWPAVIHGHIWNMYDEGRQRYISRGIQLQIVFWTWNLIPCSAAMFSQDIWDSGRLKSQIRTTGAGKGDRCGGEGSWP